ncbi:protease [Paenibacillus sp. NRS-1780]|uniref:protease n=1 Tax=Paenibacillus sp. NRS-1780 TaxID=3233904 RepID=UPI003D2BD1DE
METIFWWLLAGGAIFTVVSVLIGDVLGGWLDGLEMPSLDWFRPVVLLGAMTTFGGAGVLLTKYTGLSMSRVVLLALAIAFVVGVLVFFAFIKPVANSEVSSGFSMRELTGKIGEVTVPVPEVGYGEVMIRLGAGNTIHTASSFDHKPLAAGTRIVVVEVAEGVVHVAYLDT